MAQSEEPVIKQIWAEKKVVEYTASPDVSFRIFTEKLFYFCMDMHIYSGITGENQIPNLLLGECFKYSLKCIISNLHEI